MLKENLSILITLIILISCLIVVNNYLSKKFEFALLIETSQKETESYLQPYMSKRKQIKELREFIKKHPHTPEVIDKYIELGKIFEQIKSEQQAYQTYKSAIRKERDNPEIIKIYRLLINSAKNKKSALFKIYRDMSKRFPDDRRLADVYKKYAKMLEERKHKEEALKFYELAAKYASRKEQLNILKKSAKVYLASGNNQKALEIYNKILKDFADILKNKTEILEQITLIDFQSAKSEEKLGRSSTAIKIYNDIITNNPDTIWAKNAMGEIWIRDRSLKCPKQIYAAKRTRISPKIDGDLSDACWTEAQKATDYIDSKNKIKVSQQTVAMVSYDDKNIYFGFILYEENLSKLLIKAKTRDGKVWKDDCVEFFIDTNRDYHSYYHFYMNPNGIFADQYAPYGSKSCSSTWNGKWSTKTRIHKLKHCWTAEVSIDYASLKAKPPVYNAIWGINFNRARRAGETEVSCWSFTGKSFHTPERFGYLVFE